MATEEITAARCAAVWREVLRDAAFDGDSNFFAVGGDSLSAVRVVARVNRTFGTALSLGEFVRHPTVSGLARLVTARMGEAGNERQPMSGDP